MNRYNRYNYDDDYDDEDIEEYLELFDTKRQTELGCRECIHYCVCEVTYPRDEIANYRYSRQEEYCIHFESGEDVEHIVRCKDCKHYTNNKEGDLIPNHCYRSKDEFRHRELRDYCSYGVRKG